jgi:hypothetical protein
MKRITYPFKQIAEDDKIISPKLQLGLIAVSLLAVQRVSIDVE